MIYKRIPKSICFKDIFNNNYSLSPAMYQCVEINNPNVKEISELLDDTNKYIKGNEPGSQWYVKRSDYFLIRTKALQDFSFTIYPKGESIVPINPKKFIGFNLTKGDILLSKDSNIGEAAIVYSNECDNCDFSSGIVKLNLKKDYNPFYIYAFIKHPFFKEQLNIICPKGATIKHAGDRWLQCKIPFPNQQNDITIINYVSNCVKIIIEIEQLISKKSKNIIHIINDNLQINSQKKKYNYEYPTYQKIKKEMRLDAAIYCREYEEKIALVESYPNGYWTPEEYGFKVIPGPSLEIKLLKTRVDSDESKPGFYQLLLPMNLSEYGTINKIQYIGTNRKLPLLKKGDILFGEAGFQKGRSTVITDDINNCTTNAHGLFARNDELDIKKSIYFRCIFDWYRNTGLIDLMAVGGSGGHFSPEYFDYIRIPKFANEIIDSIVELYYSKNHLVNTSKIKMNNLNGLEKYGVIQLDQIMKYIKSHLNIILDTIIDGKVVKDDILL